MQVKRLDKLTNERWLNLFAAEYEHKGHAGRWVFATGLMGQDFINGIAPDVLAPHAPHAGLPKREKAAARIFANLDAVLRAGGTDRNNLVRTDQYYTTVKAVPPYQQVRREFPRRVVIEVEEREAKAIAALGKLYYVDRDGYIFKPV